MEQRRKEGDHSFQITHALNGVEKRIPHISTSGKRSYYLCDGYFESHEDPENPVKINIRVPWLFLPRPYLSQI